MQSSEVKSWLLSHERLILVVIGVASTIYIGRHWLDRHYDLASQAVKDTASTLTNQKQINEEQEKKYESVQSQLQQIIASLEQQNAQLAQQAAKAYQQAANQQAVDTKLNNQQLANRIDQLAKQQNIQSTDQGVQLNHDQSVGVTQQLETIPALQTQLQAEQTIVENNTKQIGGLSDALDSCNTLTTGLQKQLVDQKNADNAEIKKLKISGIRARLRWFGVGFVSGFITGKVW